VASWRSRCACWAGDGPAAIAAIAAVGGSKIRWSRREEIEQAGAVGALLQGASRGLLPVGRLAPVVAGEDTTAELAERRDLGNGMTSRQNWPSAAAHYCGPIMGGSSQMGVEEGCSWGLARHPRGRAALFASRKRIRAGDALNLVVGRGCWVGRPPRLANGERDPQVLRCPVHQGSRQAARGHTMEAQKSKERWLASQHSRAGSWNREDRRQPGGWIKWPPICMNPLSGADRGVATRVQSLSIERLSSSSSAFNFGHLDRFEKPGWGCRRRSRGKAEGRLPGDFFNAAVRPSTS